MYRKLTILTIMGLTMMIGLPLDAFGAAPARETSMNSGSGTQIYYTYSQPRRRRWRRNRSYWRNRDQWRNRAYYRNYGQYRRSMVGNRRYRMVPRYYWDDGVRRRRYVRVYYY